MIKNIFIGVDGGGTKTKMRIEDADGNLLGEARGGPAQIRVSAEQAWDSITNTFANILETIGIDPQDSHYRFHAGLALAGTEIKTAYDTFMKHPNPFHTVCLRSDAYAACLGAHNGEDGSIIIIGTGTKGLQIESGHTSEVGGWGFPQGDEGSGAWLGLQAIRLTLHYVDGRLPKSGLFDAVLAKFNNQLPELLDWTLDATSTRYATMAPIVIEQVALQDPIAIQIIKEAAATINEISLALNHHLKNTLQPLPCCLFGGIAPYIEPWLDEDLRKRIVARQFGASKGAIFMLKDYMQQQGLLS